MSVNTLTKLRTEHIYVNLIKKTDKRTKIAKKSPQSTFHTRISHQLKIQFRNTDANFP